MAMSLVSESSIRGSVSLSRFGKAGVGVEKSVRFRLSNNSSCSFSYAKLFTAWFSVSLCRMTNKLSIAFTIASAVICHTEDTEQFRPINWCCLGSHLFTTVFCDHHPSDGIIYPKTMTNHRVKQRFIGFWINSASCRQWPICSRLTLRSQMSLPIKYHHRSELRIVKKANLRCLHQVLNNPCDVTDFDRYCLEW